MFKTIFSVCLILCFGSFAVFVHGQSSPQASVKLPVLSFVVDEARGLRPVIGIPGSASVAGALNLGFPITKAAVPSGADYVLVMTAESSSPRLLQIQGDAVSIRSLDGLEHQSNRQQSACRPADAPLPQLRQASECPVEPESAVSKGQTTIDRMALSPGGSAVAFVSESQRRIYVFTNLAQSPALLGKFEVGELGPLSAFAVSDDGKMVAYGASDGNAGSLFLLTFGKPAQMVSNLRHASAITFLHRSHNAVVADDVENKIYALAGGQFFAVAATEHGISRPIGIAVSRDNQRTFVANSQSRSITTIGSNRVSEPLHCNCALTGLHPTNTDSVFRLTDFSGGPLLLFDANSASPRLIFVPISGAQ